MSYTYLLESGEESLVENCLDIPQFVQLKLTDTAEKCYCKDSEMGCCQNSQFGTTCEHSTGSPGMEKLKSSVEDSLVRTFQLQERERASMEINQVYGNKCIESFAKLDRNLCSWKTPQLSLFEDLNQSLQTWPQQGTMLNGECWDAETLVDGTQEKDSGCWLPTIVAMEYKGTSKKRFINSKEFRGSKMSEGLRTCEQDMTCLNPLFAELAMGFPIGWTDLNPLEMHKFHLWQQSHFNDYIQEEISVSKFTSFGPLFDSNE